MRSKIHQLCKVSVYIGVAIALATLALPFAPAPATGTPVSTAATYCIGQPHPLGVTAPIQSSCYPTFGASIAAATGGRVQLANAAAARYVSPDELAPGGNVIWSIDYSGSGFTGSTYSFYEPSPCGSVEAGGMPAGWNDKVVSVATESGCATTLYWNGGFGTPDFFINVDVSDPDLGYFDRQTSSQVWCPTFGCEA